MEYFVREVAEQGTEDLSVADRAVLWTATTYASFTAQAYGLLRIVPGSPSYVRDNTPVGEEKSRYSNARAT